MASRASEKPVTGRTLFEIGSVSKTFTATLASYAQACGRLKLSDRVSQHLSALRGSCCGEVSLLDLGTRTAGGLPLQVPEDLTSEDQLIRYFQGWKPTCAAGTYRTYANPSIGLLGRIAARSLDEDFVRVMESTLFPALGLRDTFLNRRFETNP